MRLIATQNLQLQALFPSIDNFSNSNELEAVTLSRGSILQVVDIGGTKVLRFYFDSDFACTEHPERLLGLPTRPYTCPVCHTMQISGLPHIEDTSE